MLLFGTCQIPEHIVNYFFMSVADGSLGCFNSDPGHGIAVCISAFLTISLHITNIIKHSVCRNSVHIALPSDCSTERIKFCICISVSLHCKNCVMAFESTLIAYITALHPLRSYITTVKHVVSDAA